MKRICHAHCPSGGGSWGFWLFLAALGFAVWAVAQALIATGKPILLAIVAGAFVLVSTVVAVGIRGSIRSDRGAEPARTSAPTRETEPVRPDEATPPTPGPLRLVSKDGRRVA